MQSRYCYCMGRMNFRFLLRLNVRFKTGLQNVPTCGWPSHLNAAGQNLERSVLYYHERKRKRLTPLSSCHTPQLFLYSFHLESVSK
jgi:hypothetical protein